MRVLIYVRHLLEINFYFYGRLHNAARMPSNVSYVIVQTNKQTNTKSPDIVVKKKYLRTDRAYPGRADILHGRLRACTLSPVRGASHGSHSDFSQRMQLLSRGECGEHKRICIYIRLHADRPPLLC